MKILDILGFLIGANTCFMGFVIGLNIAYPILQIIEGWHEKDPYERFRDRRTERRTNP